MIVRKCALQAVDSLRFPSVCQIQHTAHTGKLFIVRSADRLFEKLLLPVWVRLRKREAQFGTACCCDLGKLRCIVLLLTGGADDKTSAENMRGESYAVVLDE